MFDFFVGILVGAVIMDILWAWKTGLLRLLGLYLSGKYLLFKVNRSEWLQKLLP